MFIDAAGVSATFLMTAPIGVSKYRHPQSFADDSAVDLNIAFADEAWVLGTYSMVFAATRESLASLPARSLCTELIDSTVCRTSRRSLPTPPNLHHRIHRNRNFLPRHFVHGELDRLLRSASHLSFACGANHPFSYQHDRYVPCCPVVDKILITVQMYPEPADQAKKLALFGMAGALANTIALVLAGVFLLASWRWYFRFIVSR